MDPIALSSIFAIGGKLIDKLLDKLRGRRGD